MTFQLIYKPNETAYENAMEFYTELTILGLLDVCLFMTNMVNDPVILNYIGIVFTLVLVQYLVT